MQGHDARRETRQTPSPIAFCQMQMSDDFFSSDRRLCINLIRCISSAICTELWSGRRLGLVDAFEKPLPSEGLVRLDRMLALGDLGDGGRDFIPVSSGTYFQVSVLLWRWCRRPNDRGPGVSSVRFAENARVLQIASCRFDVSRRHVFAGIFYQGRTRRRPFRTAQTIAHCGHRNRIRGDGGHRGLGLLFFDSRRWMECCVDGDPTEVILSGFITVWKQTSLSLLPRLKCCSNKCHYSKEFSSFRVF